MRALVMVFFPPERWLRGADIRCVLLVKGVNEVAEPQVDLPIPTLPVEYPVMALVACRWCCLMKRIGAITSASPG
jgi:hypothetical protein